MAEVATHSLDEMMADEGDEDEQKNEEEDKEENDGDEDGDPCKGNE